MWSSAVMGLIALFALIFGFILKEGLLIIFNVVALAFLVAMWSTAPSHKMRGGVVICQLIAGVLEMVPGIIALVYFIRTSDRNLDGLNSYYLFVFLLDCTGLIMGIVGISNLKYEEYVGSAKTHYSPISTVSTRSPYSSPDPYLAPAASKPEPSKPTAATNVSRKSETEEKIELLKDFKKLLDEGVISQEEFDQKKKELL